MAILILADHDNASLRAATYNVITAAQKIGGDIHILVAGAQAGGAAQAAAQIPGVAKVLHADAAYLASPVAENIAATVVAVARSGGYSHVLAPATGYGKNVAPRLATLKVVEPPKRKGGGKVADAKELVAKLRGEAKVI
jgi:electron transfer flavoprotein alpha subunit